MADDNQTKVADDMRREIFTRACVASIQAGTGVKPQVIFERAVAYSREFAALEANYVAQGRPAPKKAYAGPGPSL